MDFKGKNQEEFLDWMRGEGIGEGTVAVFEGIFSS